MADEKYRDLFLDVAWTFLGKPYVWGGDDPVKGFDCSGLAIECLKSVGALPRSGDWTAHTLFNKELAKYRTLNPVPGALVFWHSASNQNHIVHVEICLDEFLSIGASGGGSRTKTEHDAIMQNAYIKVRPFRARPHIAGFVDVFSEVA